MKRVPLGSAGLGAAALSPTATPRWGSSAPVTPKGSRDGGSNDLQIPPVWEGVFVVQREREGTLGTLTRQFEHRLRRDLTETERAMLATRINRLGAERLSDVVLDLDATQLAAWLADPAAQ